MNSRTSKPAVGTAMNEVERRQREQDSDREDRSERRQEDECARHQYPEPGSPEPAPLAPFPPGVGFAPPEPSVNW